MSFGFSAGDFLAALRLAEEVRRRFVQAPEQYKAIKDEVESLSTILPRVFVLDENEFAPQGKDDVKKLIESCYNVFEELKVTLDKFGVLKKDSTRGWKERLRGKWKSLQWDKAEIDDFRRRIESKIKLYNQVVGIIDHDLLVEMRHDVRSIYEKQKDQERDQILDWLSSINPSTRQNQVLTDHHKGTGTWFLETKEFQQWMNGEQQILFCPGIPGAGKTTLASFIIHHLEQTFASRDDIGITYFYCDYRGQHTLLTLLSGLLRQFCQRQASIPDGIKSLYESHAKEKTRPSEHEILHELQSVMDMSTRVFLVVDALDECPDFYGVVDWLAHLQARVNILATSRPSIELAGAFRTGLSVEIQASRRDILSYLDSRMAHAKPFVKQSPSLKQYIKDGIMEAAGGIFLLVKLYLKSVLEERNPKRVREMIEKFGSGSHHDAYQQAYSETVERIERQHADIPEFAKKTIGWIANAKRPLTVVELKHALAIEIGSREFDEENITDLEQVTSFCCGLVVVDERTDDVRLVHHTAQEYFENIWETWFPRIHEVITDSCLTYLSYDAFEGNRDYSMEEIRRILSDYPFYAYAARNWGDHFREHPGDQSLALQYLRNKAITFPSANGRSSRFLGYRELPESGEKGEHIAAFFGLGNLMQILLDTRPNNLEVKDDIGCTPLHLAADRGHETLVKLLLDYSANVESSDQIGTTPLYLAAYQGHETVVKLLLDARANVESFDKRGTTPLHMAAYNGHDSTVKVLLAHNAEVGSSDGRGRTPLHRAAYQGHEIVVKLLLDAGANVGFFDRRGETPLYMATYNGHDSTVKALLAHSAKIGCSDEDGRTLLHRSAYQGHEIVVKLLLDDGANVESSDPNSMTPLHMATVQGHDSTVELLLARGANIESSDKHGRTPLHMAAYHGHKSTVELLLAHNAKVGSSDRYRRTPLHMAAYQGHETVIKVLLDAGAHLNPPSPGPQPLPAVASMNDHDAVVHAFLAETDGDVSFFGRTPLYNASTAGHDSVVRLLLKKGAKPDTPDRFGRTPLFAAVCGGHAAIVELLLKLPDVDSNRRDVWEITPALEAQKRGLHRISALFQGRDEEDASNLRPAPTPLSRSLINRSCDVCGGVICDEEFYMCMDSCEDRSFDICKFCAAAEENRCPVCGHQLQTPRY